MGILGRALQAPRRALFVHRVLVPWDETSTWNSLGDGLSGGELSGVIGVFSGDNELSTSVGGSGRCVKATPCAHSP